MQRFLGLIMGVLFVAVGVFMYIKNDSLAKNCTMESEATVVDMKQDFSSDSDSTSSYIYYPIIEYQANDETVRVTMDQGSSTPAYQINDKITVMYNPNKVKEFYIKGDKSSNIISIVFMAIGAVVTGFGIKMALKKN